MPDVVPGIPHDHPKGRTLFVVDIDPPSFKIDLLTNALVEAAVQCRGDSELTNTWSKLKITHHDEIQSYVETYVMSTFLRWVVKDTPRQLDYWAAMTKLEDDHFERIIKSRLFVGCSEKQWEEFGHQAQLRGQSVGLDGIGDFLNLINRLRIHRTVVSGGISRAFLRGYLTPLLRKSRPSISILVNQPDRRGDIKGPLGADGEPGPRITSSDGKLAALRGLLPGSPLSKVVYIGSSESSGECLATKGVIGIILDSEKLQLGMKSQGWNVVPIGEYNAALNDTLYFANNWKEISHSPLVKVRRTQKQ